MDFKVQTLLADSDMPLPYLFSLLSPLEQALSAPTVEDSLVSSAKLEAMASAAIISLYYFALVL